jgi:hypothetical protein
MKNETNEGKFISLSENVTLILCLISLCGLIFNLVFYEILRNNIIDSQNILAISGNIEIFVTIIFIVFFIFHISAILSIILQLNFFKRESILRSFTFFVSIISLLMIFGDFALLSDISKEYLYGFMGGIAGEFLVLYFSQGLHLLFIILVVILVIITKKKIYKKASSEIVLKDESIFINANYIGVLCGISGLVILVLLSIFEPVWAIRKGIIIITLMIVLPYIIILIYWFITKAKEKIGEWYDEKQYQDITKASLSTLIVSVVLLAIIFSFQYWFPEFGLLIVIWFPLYLFMIILLFSSITLYFSKKDTDIKA